MANIQFTQMAVHGILSSKICLEGKVKWSMNSNQETRYIKKEE
jgi:hypothetical protein